MVNPVGSWERHQLPSQLLSLCAYSHAAGQDAVSGAFVEGGL